MKITLCGSARFEKEFHHWNEILSFEGNIVYSLAIYPSSKDGNKNWYDEKQKEKLDLIHLAKIEESEAIFVIDKDGYIGESTAREISWAKIRGKEIILASMWRRAPIA